MMGQIQRIFSEEMIRPNVFVSIFKELYIPPF